VNTGSAPKKQAMLLDGDFHPPAPVLGGWSAGREGFHAVGARWNPPGSAPGRAAVEVTSWGRAIEVLAAAGLADMAGLLPGVPVGGRFRLPGSCRLGCSGAASPKHTPLQLISVHPCPHIFLPEA
jgi:hypothetical protein